MDEGSILAGLLGLTSSVAGAIPGLIPGTSEQELEEIARGGGGAGTRALRESTSQAARNALAVAGSGQGATRGLALRTGLREAERIRGQGAERAATLAAREQRSALGSLETVRQRRLGNILQLGGALGQGFSSFGAQQAASSSPQAQPAPSAATAGATAGSLTQPAAVAQAPAALAPEQLLAAVAGLTPGRPPAAPTAQPPSAALARPEIAPPGPTPIEQRAETRLAQTTAPLGQLTPLPARAAAPAAPTVAPAPIPDVQADPAQTLAQELFPDLPPEGQQALLLLLQALQAQQQGPALAGAVSPAARQGLAQGIEAGSF